MRDSRAQYVKQVGRHLCCPGAERARLLAGLETELAEAFAEGETPSLEELTARFGSPSAMAEELQSVLPEDDVARCRQRRRNRLCTGLVACAVVIVVLVGYIIWFANLDIKIVNNEVTDDIQTIIAEGD